MNIFYEDEHVIVCEKPQGVPVQSDKTNDLDMVNMLKNIIHDRGEVKGIPYVGLVHRLDRPVGGVMVFAKNKNAASSLGKQISQKKVLKKYLAVITTDIEQVCDKSQVKLIDYLKKDAKANKSFVVDASTKDSKKAELTYEVLATKKLGNNRFLALVEIDLETGRHHQIRVQFSSRNMSLWGDTKYNKDFSSLENAKSIYGELCNEQWENIALYAYELGFEHPKTGKYKMYKNKPDISIFKEVE